MEVPGALRRALRDDLKHGRLSGLAAVKSRDSYDFPRGLAEGVYFVSADVKPNPGIATWGVSKSAFKTGGGLIFAIDAAARAVTDFGADVDPSRLGLDEGSDGFEASRGCVGKV